MGRKLQWRDNCVGPSVTLTVELWIKEGRLSPFLVKETRREVFGPGTKSFPRAYPLAPGWSSPTPVPVPGGTQVESRPDYTLYTCLVSVSVSRFQWVRPSLRLLTVNPLMFCGPKSTVRTRVNKDGPGE